MRRTGIILTLAAALVAALIPVAGRAATVSVQVMDPNWYSPRDAIANPGDTITWTWKGALFHSVTAYSPATAFPDSGLKSSGTYSATFGGGVWRYYCRNHGTVATDPYGNKSCTGMCGTVATPPPTITMSKPMEGAIVTSPVRFEGIATASGGVEWVKVLVYNLLGMATLHPATCSGCPGTSVTWSADLSLLPGTYPVAAQVKELGQMRYATTRAIRIFVLPVAP